MSSERRLSRCRERLEALGASTLDRDAMQHQAIAELRAAIVVRRSGNSAALRFQVHFDLLAGPAHVTHEGWITELYERRNGHWQIVWEQATAVPNRFDEFVQSIEPPEPTG